MKRDWGPLVLVAIASLLAALSVCAAVVSVSREGLGPNSAAWMQAAGSIAAIAGAVWLYRSETIQRRRERRLLGEQNAWAIRFILGQAQYEARSIAAQLVDKDIHKHESPRRHWLLQSENCQNVCRVFAERTDHLHPILNQVASNALLLLKQLDEDIHKVSDSIEKGERPSMELTSDISRYEGHFYQLQQMLDERMRGILHALNRGGDMLPTSLLDVWKVPKGYKGPDE